jgi:deoxyribonuclease IV
MIRFGPAGNSESFYAQGNKSSVQMPQWLKSIGLSAYEYQCGKGVNIGQELARKLGEQASTHDIFISIHAPYYINLASTEAEKRENSKNYILESMEAAQWMGAKRVVVHTGSCAKVDREWALKTAIDTLKETLQEADRLGYTDVAVCPELLGKMNQLGSLEEILEICKIDERVIPTIDFGHLHARGLGCLNSVEDFQRQIETMENAIGEERCKKIHIHFSRIEFTKGGEKRHWTLEDTQFGPEFEHLAEVMVKKRMEPVIICESKGNMAEDALKMKYSYENLTGGRKT